MCPPPHAERLTDKPQSTVLSPIARVVVSDSPRRHRPWCPRYFFWELEFPSGGERRRWTLAEAGSTTKHVGTSWFTQAAVYLTHGYSMRLRRGVACCHNSVVACKQGWCHGSYVSCSTCHNPQAQLCCYLLFSFLTVLLRFLRIMFWSSCHNPQAQLYT